MNVPLPFRRRLVQPISTNTVRAVGEGHAPITTITPSTVVTPSEPPFSTGLTEGSKVPPRWAVALLALVLILVAALIGLGHPVSYVLEALAGGGYLGIELVRLLNREM